MRKKERDRLFVELFGKHRKLVNGVVRNIGKYLSYDDADEVVQTVMVEAWEKFDPAKAATFRFWIVLMARGRTVDMIRRCARHVRLDDEHDIPAPDDDAPTPPDQVDESARLFTLGVAIERLTPPQREVIKLYRQGLPHKLIAEELGISEDSARVRLFRGLAGIRKQMIPARRSA